ncbi:MAG: hypothetical protein E2581_20570 [Pseudomonas sp.]|uniref:hypothetical protein n=1 Tax=Pseudomonas sp. TaxID=306 RepID=UPI001E0DF9D2|nr:hypothetical protein [Pseudomonas sp.]MPT00872.1 hypothetical protein [Pseudomonas sp.]
MQVIGINDDYTKGPNEVAVELSNYPNTEIIKKMSLREGLTVHFIDGVVVLKSKDPLSVSKRDIQEFENEYHSLEQRKVSEEIDAKKKRKEMLNAVSESLQLRLKSQFKEYD